MVIPDQVEPWSPSIHCAVALDTILYVVAVVLDGVNVIFAVDEVIAIVSPFKFNVELEPNVKVKPASAKAPVVLLRLKAA